MVITYGCVFIEIAKKINESNYDWSNKVVFPLSQDQLDSLIYSLTLSSFYSIQNNTHCLNIHSDGLFQLNSLTTLDILISKITIPQLNGLRIMLEQAKIKTYGWN